MTSPIQRKLIAEATGTMFLVAAVIGSGIAASRLSPHDTGLQLLENAIATGAALTALILALQPVSAAFNPVITVIEAGEGTLRWGHAASAVGAQIAGGTLGAITANLMFGLPAISIATTARTGPAIWLAEVVATAGLVMVIGGTARSGRADWTAFAVGGYITAAYWFTSSTSFANPAVTVARMLSDSFAGVAPSSVPPFLLAQAVGGAVGYFLNQSLYPRRRLVGADLPTDQAVDASQQQQHPDTQTPRHPDTQTEDIMSHTDIPAERLTSDAMPEELANGEQPRPFVLFVCVHNAGRSQMAAAYMKELSGGAIEVRSAGSEPAGKINPVAVQAMAEEGIDITAEQPKILTNDTVKASDVVITMGCGDTCPYYPGKRYEDWTLDDPAGQGIDVVRPIRNQIRQRVEQLIRELQE